MSRKLPNINCQCYRDGDCAHHMAPRGWFIAPRCILTETPKDPRVVVACALQYPYARPDGKPQPPPSRIVRESGRETLAPHPTTNESTWLIEIYNLLPNDTTYYIASEDLPIFTSDPNKAFRCPTKEAADLVVEKQLRFHPGLTIKACEHMWINNGPDYGDGHDHEGFVGGCARFGCPGGDKCTGK